MVGSRSALTMADFSWPESLSPLSSCRVRVAEGEGEVSTLQQISYYAKMIIPFLAAMLSLITAYVDGHRRWKLIGSLSIALFFFGSVASAFLFDESTDAAARRLFPRGSAMQY